MPEKPAFRSSRMHLYAGVLVVAGIIAFANSLPNRALFDHVPNAVVDPVLDNSIVRGGGLFGKIFGGEFLLSTYGRYRPVGYACLSAVVTSIGRHSYVSWRVLMVGLHLVTGVLVLLSARMLVEGRSALIIAAAYVLCPLVVPVVNDVNMIYLLWGLLLSAGVVLTCLIGLKTGKAWALVVSVALYLAACFAYPHAAALILLVAGLALLHDRAPAAAAVLAGSVALAAALAAIGRAPLPLLLSGLLVVLALFAAFAGRVDRVRLVRAAKTMPPYVIAAAAYFVVAACVEPRPIHQHFLDNHLFGPHRVAEPAQLWFIERTALFGSALNVIALAAAAAAVVLAVIRRRGTSVAAAACLAVALAGAIAQNGVYRSDVTYWESTSRRRPGHDAVSRNLARAYIGAERYEEARDMLMALAYGGRPRAPLFMDELRHDLGLVYQGLGNDKVAGFYHFNFGNNPPWDMKSMKNIHLDTSAFAFRTGYISAAEHYWACPLVVDPYDARLYAGLGRALVYKNFFRAAARYFERVLELVPGDEAALYHLAFIAKVLDDPVDYEHYGSGWREATGRAEIDFTPVYERYDGYSLRREEMLEWFSPEPLTMGLTVDFKVRGLCRSEFEGRTYSFPEVPREVGSHFLRSGEYERAVEYLALSHKSDPSSAETLRLLIEACRKAERITDAMRFEGKLKEIEDGRAKEE